MHSVVSRIALSVSAVALFAGGLVAAGGGAALADTPRRPPQADAAGSGSFTSLAPARLLDTRVTGGPLAKTETRSLQVTNVGGVPSDGVAAVAVNLTVVTPQVAGYLSAFPGPTQPTVSNLNFAAGQTVANYAVVPVAGGTIQLYNGSVGRTDVLVDVTGWFAPVTGSAPAADGGFKTTGPTRLVDTRKTTPTSPIPANGFRKVTVRGGAIPATAGAAVLNITAIGAGTAGYVTVYRGGTRPKVSNLSFAAGQTVAGLAAAQLAADGSVTLYNSSPKPLQVAVDVSGWFLGTTARTQGNLSILSPTRVFDSRSPKATLAAQATRTIPVGGRGGVPTTGVAAVVLTVTVTNTQGAGYLTVYPGGTRPKASALNFVHGATVPNLVVVPVTNGAITVFNGSAGSIDVLADVSGFVRSTTLTAPSTSVSRYVNDLLSADSNGAITEKMHQHGCDDISTVNDADPRFTLLEFGAQSNQVPVSGGGLTTGVLPPNTVNKQRLTYAQVVTAVKGYIDGVSSCRTEVATGEVTVAVGTSNDGFLGATYAPNTKGTDWASKVVTPLVAYGNANSLTVVGASDIEPNFDGTAAEVKTWITNFLAGNTLQFVNNGAAPACPSTFGQVNTTCQSVGSDHEGSPAQTWSQADYVAFSRGLGPTRISVLPQIYDGVSAVRWENISLTSNAIAGGPLTFAGVLTQYAVCGDACSFTPVEGWAAMRQSLDTSTVTASTALPTVSDIDYDS